MAVYGLDPEDAEAWIEIQEEAAIYDIQTGQQLTDAQIAQLQPAPPDPVEVPGQVPIPDAPVIYSGPGAVPTWADVHNWTVGETHAHTPDLQTSQPASGAQVARALDVATGSMIKSLGGFINQAFNVDVLATNIVQQRITDVETVVAAISAAQNGVDVGIRNELNLIANTALPQIRTEIAKLQAMRAVDNADVIKIIQVWTTENIFNPIEKQLAELKESIPGQIKAEQPDISAEVKSLVESAIAPTVATVAALGTQVASLAEESTECVTPMCDVMGPKTNLGKLLKGLNLVADAALIAKLLEMTPEQLADFFRSVIAHFAKLATAFETYFAPGSTETLGGLIGNVGLSVLPGA